MTIDSLAVAKAFAAELNAAGAKYEARAGAGPADALLVSEAEDKTEKITGLLIRPVAPDAPAEAAAKAVAAALAPGDAKRAGVLTVLAKTAPKAANAGALAAGLKKIFAALEKTAAAEAGLQVLEKMPPGCGFEYASWAPRPEGLAVEILYKVPTYKARVKIPGAPEHWLVIALPGADRPLARAVPLKLPDGDIVQRLAWAVPKGAGWTFPPF